MAASPAPAGVVEQSLPDLPPAGLLSVQPDGVGLLDLDNASPARHAAGYRTGTALDSIVPKIWCRLGHRLGRHANIRPASRPADREGASPPSFCRSKRPAFPFVSG